MDQQKILDLLDAEPFQPFNIRTSDGRAYMVDDPGYFARSRDGSTITGYTRDDRIATINVSQIISLEIANRPAV